MAGEEAVGGNKITLFGMVTEFATAKVIEEAIEPTIAFDLFDFTNLVAASTPTDGLV
jgi:hypothetical protein